MERTVFSLGSGLYNRVKALAAREDVSMAELIRETVAAALDAPKVLRVAEPGPVYVAVAERPVQQEEGGMKRIVVSLPEGLHHRLRVAGESHGVSMAAYVRETLEERTRRERPKPQFGAFASGYADTAEKAGEFDYEPRSWR